MLLLPTPPMVPDGNLLRGIGTILHPESADIVLSVLKILRKRLWRRRCFVRLCAETTSIKNVSINGQGAKDKKDLKSLAVLPSFQTRVDGSLLSN